jgi:hypothetical protein
MHAKERGPIEHGSQDYLIVRMVHIAEATSNAIRMNATWELTAPTMSLVRDRIMAPIRPCRRRRQDDSFWHPSDELIGSRGALTQIPSRNATRR